MIRGLAAVGGTYLRSQADRFLWETQPRLFSASPMPDVSLDPHYAPDGGDPNRGGRPQPRLLSASPMSDVSLDPTMLRTKPDRRGPASTLKPTSVGSAPKTRHRGWTLRSDRITALVEGETGP